jgi:hypothetical protein
MQFSLTPDLQQRARKKAAAVGISFAEYVRRVVARDLREPERSNFDITRVFDPGSSKKPTDIGHEKDELLGEAIWSEHHRKIGRTRRKKT